MQSGPEHVGIMRRGHDLVVSRIRLIMIALGVITALLLAAAFGIDEGEIVTLVSLDSNGMEHETQLWFVGIDGVQYLRASNSDAEWLARVEANPIVTIERNEVRAVFEAQPSDDPEISARVNAAMAEKYGFADHLWAVVSERSRSVPIRLAPAPADATPLRSDSPHGEEVAP